MTPPSQRRRRQPEPEPEIGGGAWLGLGILAAGAVGAAAYFFNKKSSSSETTTVSTAPRKNDYSSFSGTSSSSSPGLNSSVSSKKLVATTASECLLQVKPIIEDAREYPVIGMDCQWRPVTSQGQKRRPVALLQLASHKGNIALIQLSEIGKLPNELLYLMSDKNIIKAGIETERDAGYLFVDYRIEVKSTFDIRHLAADVKVSPKKLKTLARDVLGILLCREEDFLESDWEEPGLNSELIKYAQSAVKCSIDVFVNLIERKFSNPTKGNILEYCQPFFGRKFDYQQGLDYVNA